MLINVTRFTSDEETTISAIFVDGRFFCFGLEDEYRRVKVPGETRIPAGTYNVKPRTFGGFHARYAEKFADIHRGMLEICDIPGFTDVLIHVGNTEKHTAGCLLVGTGAQTEPGDMSIQNSVNAYRRLYMMVIGPAIAGQLSIKFVDQDRG